jgi:hypothetical protein
VTSDPKQPEETPEDEFNFGVATLGNSDSNLSKSQRTYVVMGVSRGGTSAVAGVLSQFGVFMGKTGEAPLFEDLPMNRALAGPGDKLDSLVSDYNDAHDIWGFKGNAISQDFDDVLCRLRNPVVVVVFRDLLAIANRARISADRDLAAIMQRQAREYLRIADFIACGDHYFVLVSFEKLCAYPAQVTERIASSLSLKVTAEQLTDAQNFIQPAPADYLLVSRANNRTGLK